MDGKYLTVAELIEELKKWPQDATIGVRAGCCSHAHEFSVRLACKEDWADESAVIIDAAV